MIPFTEHSFAVLLPIMPQSDPGQFDILCMPIFFGSDWIHCRKYKDMASLCDQFIVQLSE